MIEVPRLVRNKAIAHGQEAWLEDLPQLVSRLEREWEITIGSAFGDGSEAFVAEAVLAEGTPAVLKILMPGRGAAARHEITVLRLAHGEGCPVLFRADEESGAFLMERLGRSLHDLDLPLMKRREILADAAKQLWRPAADAGLPTGAEKAQWLVDFIERTWSELGRPCSRRAVDHALACARRREAAHDDERAVLVHGDVHSWNALEADGGFKLVDPDGLLAEAEYDLGVIFREDPVDLLEIGDPYAQARALADLAGCDADAVWEWAVVERVSTGLVCTQIGLQPLGQQMLHAAEVIAAL